MSLVDQVIQDLKSVPVLFLAERGHSKSTSAKHIISKALEMDSSLIVKVFDVSMSWYWCAPLRFRQLVTAETIDRDEIDNIGSCVYEMGQLSDDDRRAFLASIIHADFKERYNTAKNYGPDTLKGLPTVVYVLEEVNTYLGSYSLRKGDMSAQILVDFVSVGRNYGLTFLGLTTCLSGEVSPSVRNRCRLLLGRVTSDADLRVVKARTDAHTRDISKSIAKYYFVYGGIVERIPDSVRSRPMDYKVKTPTPTIVDKPKTEKDIAQTYVKTVNRLSALTSIILVLGLYLWLFS